MEILEEEEYIHTLYFTHFALFEYGMAFPSLLLNLCIQCCDLFLCGLNVFGNCPNFTTSLFNINSNMSL
jgi:hypothetical protein